MNLFLAETRTGELHQQLSEISPMLPTKFAVKQTVPMRGNRPRPPSHSSWPIWLVLLVTLSVAGFCVWKAEQSRPVQTVTVPISQIRLGDRVPGENPEGESEDAPVLAECWRAVSIEATLEDGSRLELDLLRPESWVRAHGLTVGADVPVEFGETHTQSGTGKVKRINPCPPLRAGPGKIVTGLFRHATPELFTVSTADGERLNATAEHPFWSEDRQAFVPVKDLQPGERLRHLTGETSVVSVHSRPARETVYNLEVHGSHVFHVGQSGLLVHNCGGHVIGRTSDLKKAGAVHHGERTIDMQVIRNSDGTINKRATWASNSSGIRRAMREGNPIRDVSPGDKNGMFLNAERMMLESQGWIKTMIDGDTYYVPPGWVAP